MTVLIITRTGDSCLRGAFTLKNSTAYRFESTWDITQTRRIASVRALNPPLLLFDLTVGSGCRVDVPIRVVFGLELGISDLDNRRKQGRSTWNPRATCLRADKDLLDQPNYRSIPLRARTIRPATYPSMSVYYLPTCKLSWHSIPWIWCRITSHPAPISHA